MYTVKRTQVIRPGKQHLVQEITQYMNLIHCSSVGGFFCCCDKPISFCNKQPCCRKRDRPKESYIKQNDICPHRRAIFICLLLYSISIPRLNCTVFLSWGNSMFLTGTGTKHNSLCLKKKDRSLKNKT